MATKSHPLKALINLGCDEMSLRKCGSNVTRLGTFDPGYAEQLRRACSCTPHAATEGHSDKPADGTT